MTFQPHTTDSLCIRLDSLPDCVLKHIYSFASEVVFRDTRVCTKFRRELLSTSCILARFNITSRHSEHAIIVTDLRDKEVGHLVVHMCVNEARLMNDVLLAFDKYGWTRKIAKVFFTFTKPIKVSLQWMDCCFLDVLSFLHKCERIQDFCN
eukprot:110204-Hanusia_phi.AAC.1